ncbi:MAG: DUF4351 domain-containing protein [Cyanobacteria bacterium P01_G01_bin.49]
MKESVIYQDWLAQGRRQGQASLILSQLKRRIGEIKSEDETRINSLSEEQLQGLGDVLLDFSSRDDLLAWFASNLD